MQALTPCNFVRCGKITFYWTQKSLCVTFELTVYAWAKSLVRWFAFDIDIGKEKKSSVGDSLFCPSVLAADNRPR